MSGDVVLMTIRQPVPADVLEPLIEACKAWAQSLPPGDLVLRAEDFDGGVCEVVLAAPKPRT